MPAGWVHATLDLISFGRLYFQRHKAKDKPSKTLGWEHRRLYHKYYQVFGKRWDFKEPFPLWLRELTSRKTPDEAELLQSYVSHDYFDRIWDGLPNKERRYWERFCMYVLRRPKLLREWAGVDVKRAKIKRLINNKEVWEDCPSLIYEYERLKKYVRKVKESLNHKSII